MTKIGADRQSKFMAKLTYVFLGITSRHVDLQSLIGLNAISSVTSSYFWLDSCEMILAIENNASHGNVFLGFPPSNRDYGSKFSRLTSLFPTNRPIFFLVWNASLFGGSFTWGTSHWLHNFVPSQFSLSLPKSEGWRHLIGDRTNSCGWKCLFFCMRSSIELYFLHEKSWVPKLTPSYPFYELFSLPKYLHNWEISFVLHTHTTRTSM